MASTIRKEWTTGKDKLDKIDFKGNNGKPLIDPQKLFGKSDFGPTLDEVSDAVKVAVKDPSPKNLEVADQLIVKAVGIARDYQGELASALAKVRKENKKAADQADQAVGSALISVLGTCNNWRAEMERLAKTAVREDPEPLAKAVDAVVKKAIAALGTVASKADPISWNTEFLPTVRPICQTLLQSTALQKKYLKPFDTMRKDTIDEADVEPGQQKRMVLTKVKDAAGLIKDLQSGYRKALGL